jgi:tetratricopeptide (TPR) repeat protein
MQGALGLIYGPAAYRSAEAALQRALDLDSENADAKCAVVLFKIFSTRDWKGAQAILNEGVVSQPTFITGKISQGLLRIACGCPQEASSLLWKVAQDNILNTVVMEAYCWSEYLAGEYAKALQQIEDCRACGQLGYLFDVTEALASIQVEAPGAHIMRLEALVADFPHHYVLQGALGYAHAMNGNRQRAIELLDAMMNPNMRGKGCKPYGIALIQIGLNEKDKAMYYLDQSYREGAFCSLGFLSDPILASLRNDPHCQTALSKITYPASFCTDSDIGDVK